jgi:hypothetical protein
MSLLMKYTLIFEHKELPPTVNELKRMNKYAYAKIRNYWTWVLISEVSKNPPPHPLDRYKLTLIRCSSVEPDYDGLVGSFKVVVDSMQVKISKNVHGAGLTTGDSFNNTGAWNCSWMKAKQGQGSIIVKVEAEIDQREDGFKQEKLI